MLVAHLVPGYIAARQAQTASPAQWSPRQRALLWSVALGSTVAPDADVIYNALLRGFVNHSTLWTHSLWVYLIIGALWWMLRGRARATFVCLLLSLVVWGGLSHLALDAISHSTPLLYPFSSRMIGIAPTRVVEDGLFGYLTHPIILLEPLMIAAAVYFKRGKS